MTLVSDLRCHPPVPDPGHLLPPVPVSSVLVSDTVSPGHREAHQRTGCSMVGELIYQSPAVFALSFAYWEELLVGSS